MGTKLRKIKFVLLNKQRSFFYRRFLRKRIKNLIKKIPSTYQRLNDDNYLKECRYFLEKYFPGYKNTNWHYFYSTLNGIKDPRYIPEEIYFGYLDPLLNNYDYYLSYMDKFSFDLLIDNEYIPKTVMRITNNRFYDGTFSFMNFETAMNYLGNYKTELVIKPAINSGSGKNITIDEAKNIVKLLREKQKYKSGSFVVQEAIRQHPLLAKFHPRSVNSLRIMTANLGEKTVVLSSYINFGRDNQRIDNGAAGGITCGIDKIGALRKYAIDIAMNKYDKHPNSNLKFEGFKVPYFEKAVDFCIQQHKRFIRLTFISWDIAIGENDEPIFIEMNFRRQAIYGHQRLNGSLFGDYTDAVFQKYFYEKTKEPIYY